MNRNQVCFLILSVVAVLFLSPVVWAHTVQFHVDKVKRVSDPSDEVILKEIYLIVQINWGGTCDNAPSSIVATIPADPDKVIRFKKKKRIKQSEGFLGECFRVIQPQEVPWPFVGLIITAVEVDVPDFDSDLIDRDPQDKDASDHGEHRENIIDIPCPVNGTITRGSAEISLWDTEDGEMHGIVEVDFSLLCVD